MKFVQIVLTYFFISLLLVGCGKKELPNCTDEKTVLKLRQSLNQKFKKELTTGIITSIGIDYINKQYYSNDVLYCNANVFFYMNNKILNKNYVSYKIYSGEKEEPFELVIQGLDPLNQ